MLTEDFQEIIADIINWIHEYFGPDVVLANHLKLNALPTFVLHKINITFIWRTIR